MRVSSYSAFDGLPEPTRQLFQKAGDECFFNGLPWFRNFVRNGMDPGDQLRIYCVESGAPKCGPKLALPMVRRAADSGFWKLRKLSSLSSYYSSLFGPAWNGELSHPVTRELACAIASDSPRWDAVELKPLAIDSPAFSDLVEGLKAAGFVVQTYFCFGNWYLEVEGRNFAEYMESLPSTLKNTLSRKKKKLMNSGRAVIEIVTDGPDLEASIEAYNQVYLSSWKQPEPYPFFVPGLIRTCAALGALRLGIVRVGGQPAAAQIWIVRGGSALIYKLAYDERFKELSAGTILTAALMQHVIDIDRVRKVDYLSGDDTYKKDWMSHRRELWGILAMNPLTPRGALAIARHVGGRALKRAAFPEVRFGRKSTRERDERSGNAATNQV
jgi:hypothetical protein